MPTLQKTIATAFIAGALLTPFTAQAQSKTRKLPFVQQEWSKDYRPFRIAGNLYYVGTYDLACYLIATPKGHILINTGLEESVPLIRKHMQALGFKFEDIKILLATHAHYDHVAGIAAIKKATGAKFMIQEKDAKAMTDGGASDYALGGHGATFEAVQPDQLLKNCEIIKLGTMQVKLLHHPGHTPGASSFSFTVRDEKRAYKVLIANMPSILDETKLSGMPGYPEVGKDYAKTLAAMKNEQFDIWLSSHASQFSLHEKHKPIDPYHPEAFFDKAGYDKSLATLKKRYDEKIRSSR
ncbi:MAG TPA: subclass B3 metallo-beta-lactamase [Dyadobacter sp.]|nr:subclass B3 metallo-beta-lactamase [Dyadobacter sp.]